MKILRRYRTSLGVFMTALVAIWQLCSPVNLSAATFYWDGDGNGSNGVLGGSGTWNTASAQWDPDAADNTNANNTTWSNAGNHTAVFGGTAGTVTLGELITAGGLTFNSTGYVLTGSALTLAPIAGVPSPVVAVNNTGSGTNRVTIESILAGTSGLTKTGNGTLVLANNLNSFSGDISIKQGQLVITDAGQLGTGTTAISVTGVAQIGNPGYSGGTLMLQGSATSAYGAGITLNREVSVSGRGPNAVNNTGGLVSIGYNTLAGGLTFGSAVSDSRVWATHGSTTISGDVFLNSSAQNQIFQGNGNWIISGQITGTEVANDRLLKVGQLVSTTLWLQNPANNFAQSIRIDSGTVRVGTNGALGLNAGTAAVDLNNGTLEVRTDAPNFGTRNVQVRNNTTGTIFVDRAIGGTGLNQTVAFGGLLTPTSSTNTTTVTLTGRNGYGVSFNAATLGSGAGEGNLVFNNNTSGTLTLNGNLQGANTSASARTITIQGNGDSILNGNFTPGGTQAHNFTKSGTGLLTITGTASTHTGNTTISNGTLAINSFGGINATTGTLHIGNGTTTSGALSYLGAAGTGAGETVTKTININTTTSNDVIFANQSGTAPTALVISGTITALAGSKILYLGGSNYQNGVEIQLNNEITSQIPDSGTLQLAKTGTGTWVLSNQNNLYNGTTSIYGGTLKLNATADGTTSIIKTGGAVAFAADTAANTGWTGTQTAAGTLQYNGFSSGGVTSNTQGLGALSVTAGAATVLINPGTNNTATLTFTSLVTPSAGTGLNFVVPGGNTVQIGGTAGFINAHAYFNGADFAYSGGSTILRAPVYDTDASFVTAGAALTAASHNLVAAATNTGAMTISSLKISGNQTVTQTGLLTIQTAANSAGGILQTGGSGVITGTGVTTGGSGDLVVRVNGGSDVLTLSAPITSTTTGGLTKNGLGTLILSGTNAQTGATTINEGVLQLSGTGTLSGNNQALVIRQGGVLDLNGVSTGTAIGSFNGSGVVRNTSVTAATLRIGNGVTTNGGAGLFSGLLEDGAGVLNVSYTTANNTAGQTTTYSVSGLNTYTGVTTLEKTTLGNLVLSVTSLANIGEDSGIGRGDDTSDATNAASLVFNGGTLQYTGSTATIFQMTQTPSVSIDRLFTLAGSGRINSSGQYGNNFLGAGAQNNATLIFNNTADLSFSGAGTRSLTLGGNSTGDNEMRIRLRDNPNAGEALSLTKADGGLWILNPLTSNTYTGETLVSGGALRVAGSGSVIQGLSAGSLLTLNGGVLETSGTFTRTLGALAGNVRLTGGASGFAAATSDRLVVTLGGGTLFWGSSTFAPTSLVLGSSTALGETEITNDIELNGANRTVTVTNNGSTGTMMTAGIISGVISNGAGSFGLTKNGAGVLMLGNANTYNGNTTIADGTLVLSSIGADGAASSSLGTNVGGGSLIINRGDGDINAFIYVGAGETTTRELSLQTAASALSANRTWRIDASGSGALTLGGAFTNTTSGNAAGRIVTLELRGANADNNMITSQLINSTHATNPAILAIGKNDGGVWILNPSGGANSFTGNITVSGGLLGLTENGIGTAGSIVLSNGGIFAYGGALTTSTPLTLGNNAAAIFAGQNNITFNSNVTKAAGTNDQTFSNNLEGGALLTINGNYINNENPSAIATRTLNIRGFGSTVWDGVIADNANVATSAGVSGSRTAVSIAIANDATVTLSGGANTYTGATTLSQGTLILNKVTALGAAGFGGTANFNFNGGVLQAGLALTGGSALANPVILNGDPATVSGSNSMEWSGLVTNNGGNRLLQNNLTGLATLTLTAANAISLSNDNTGRTLTILGSGTTNVQGIVQNGGTGAGGLAYSGSGLLSLTAANTATGALTVNRGTIILSGASGSWNAGTIVVNTSGILRLDNSAISGGENGAGRLFDTGAISLSGGTLDFIGDGDGTSETTGALTLGAVATSKITMSGAGPNVLTFASVSTPNTGSSLDVSGITGLGSTNKVFFTNSTGLNMTNNVVARVFVGGSDFATYDANGLGVFSSYNNTNDLNAALATDTMNVTANATISASKTLNALKINGSGLTVGSANGNTLTLTAAGILNTGGNNTLSQSTLALGGVTGFFQVQTGTQLEVTSVMTGTAGFSKTGGGTLLLSTPSLVTSTTNVLEGTLRLNGGLNTLNANQILNVQLGGALDLNGNTQYVGQLQSPGTMPNTGGTITSGVGTGTLAINMNVGSTSFAGQITGNVNFGRIGGNTLTLESAQTYAGQTMFMGGTTTLQDDATLANTTSIALNYSTLSLSNNTSLQIQNNNRINDAAGISMSSGTITFTGRVSTTASETFGVLTLAQGANTINAALGGGTINSSEVTFTSLAPRAAGTTLNFTGTNLGQQGNSSRIIFATPLTAVGSGVLGAWAIANTTDYAAYNSGNGIGVVGSGGYTGYSSTFDTGNITIIPAPTANVTTNLSGNTTTALLKIDGAFTNDITFAGASDTLNLELGGILRSNNNNATTIGTTTTRGVVTAGGTEVSGTRELIVYNNQGTTTINSIIANNGFGNTVALVKSGGGTLALSAANTYTGGTTVSQGTLTLNGGVGSVVLPSGGLTMTGATVTMVTNNGQIDASNAVTLNGSSTLTLVGNNTLDSLEFNNNGGTTNPTVNVGGILTLSNAAAITVSSNNAQTTATVAGGTLALGATSRTFDVSAPEVAGQVYSRTAVSLNITSVITGSGAFTKNGNGIMQLSGASTFTGPISVNAGTLKAGVASVANVNGAFGLNSAITLANTADVTLDITGFNTQIGSLAGGGITGGNVVLGAATLTTGGDNSSTTFAGSITGTGGLTKIGGGIQTLSGVSTYTGATTITAGALNLTGSLTGGTAITVSGSGVLTESAAGVISGASSITHSSTGTSTLSGVNTYTGVTNVSGGLLNVNGSTAAASVVTVSGGAIGGTGTINGAVTLSNVGGINLDDGVIGTLALGGNLDITGVAGANNLRFDLGMAAGGTDKITVAGATTITNAEAAVITLNQLGGIAAPINAGTYTLIQGTGSMAALSQFSLGTTSAFGRTFSLAVNGNNLDLTSAAAAAGPAAAFWSGVSDNNWSTAANWNTDATSAITAGSAPGFQTNVTFHTTIPAAANLTTNVLDVDFDINSLNYSAAATSDTIIGGTKMLTIEATNANGNTPGNGITVNTPSSGTPVHTIAVNVGLASSQTWTVGSGGALVVSGVVSDFGGGYALTKAGAGSLTLSRANTYTGTTTVSGGLLALFAAGSLSDISAVNITGGTATFNISAISAASETVGSIAGVSGASIVLGSKNLTAGGDNSSTTFAGSITGVTGSLTKTGTGSLTLSGLSATAASNYTGTTTISQGTLAITTTNPVFTGGLTFGATAGSTAVGALDLSTASATFGGATLVQTNSATANTITIGSGQTLRLNGSVTVGYSSAATTTTRLTANGAGTLTIGAVGAATNANVLIGGGTIDSSPNAAVFDMSGLSTFYANLGTGTFRLGDPTNGAGAATVGSTLILAADSTILATTITSDSPSGAPAVQAIKLGSGTNIFNATTINIGGAGQRAVGTLDFNVSTGTFLVRNLAGTGRAAMNVASGNASTGFTPSGTVDLLGHSSDLLLSTLAIGGRSAGTTGSTTAAFSFDTGILDVLTVNLASRTGTSITTGNVTSSLTLGGGTTTIGTLTMSTNSATTSTSTGDATSTINISGGTNAITTMTMGTLANTGATSVTSSDAIATVNISGGTTTIGTLTMGANNTTAAAVNGANTATSTLNISGGSVNVTNNLTMGNTTLRALNAATSSISITGSGSLTVGGNIEYTDGAGTETNTITLNGGTLDMTNGSIGAGSDLVTFNAQSGTLSNVSELNGGGTLTKTTNGMLTLAGTNSYTGATVVSAGTLRVGVGGTGTSGTGAFTAQTNSTLIGTGIVQGSSATFASNSTLRPGDSLADSSHGTLTFTPVSVGTHNIQAGANVVLGITTATVTDATYGGNVVGSAGYNAWLDGISGVGNHDQLIFNGAATSTLTFSGNLDVIGSAYTPAAGQVFNLLDWAALVASDFSGFSLGANYRDGSGDDLDQFNLADISGTGFVWDVSRFATSGNIAIVAVVPEPSRMLLLMFGLMTLFLRRRRTTTIGF